MKTTQQTRRTLHLLAGLSFWALVVLGGWQAQASGNRPVPREEREDVPSNPVKPPKKECNPGVFPGMIGPASLHPSVVKEWMEHKARPRQHKHPVETCAPAQSEPKPAEWKNTKPSILDRLRQELNWMRDPFQQDTV